MPFFYQCVRLDAQLEVMANKENTEIEFEATEQQSVTPLALDWTDAEALARYTTETGKILPRKNTGLTAKAQRHVARMIKRGRNMLLAK